MTKQFVILLGLFLVYYQAFAVHVPQKQDTTKNHILYKITERNILPSDYKLSKKTFVLRYGFSEEAVDLIESHFSRRSRSIFFIFIPLIFFILGYFSFIMLLLTVLVGLASASMWSALFFGSIVGYIVGWVYRIVGIINLSNFKREKLLNNLINNYKNYTK